MLHHPLGPQFAILFLACPGVLAAQTFVGVSATIPDDGSVLEIPLIASGLPATVDTIGFGLERVCITITHPLLSSLEVLIVAPDGTTGLLASGQGEASDAFANTCFSDDAAISITNGTPPFTGTYRPQGQMGVVNNGQSGNGEWRLHVLDISPGADAGLVISWSITFGNEPAGYLALHSSNLPIVVIDTDGGMIIDEDRIIASMGIVDNGPGNMNNVTDPFNDYQGFIGIDLRGTSSLYLSPKKSYGVELWDAAGVDVEAPILGMPEETDWILSANHFDKSLMNNTLTYHLARAMGHYAPRHRHVELILNGQYEGVYVLMERIKRDPGRLDIAKLDSNDISGDDLTGGYILSVDRDNGPENGFVSPYPPAVSGNGQHTYMEYRYPKPDNILPEQTAYIQAFIDTFETALAGPDFADPAVGYRAYADVPSFVDVFLLNELSRNVDAYRLSGYLYKDKNSNGGKLHMGPVWDYDIAWANAYYCEGANPAGWAYAFGDACPDESQQVPFWWPRLQEDPYFVNAVRCRWNELRGTLLSIDNLETYCDSVALLLDAAQQRNFTVWPILGQYVVPNPWPYPTTYAGEVQELKNWIEVRWAWIDANLPGDPPSCSQVGLMEVQGAALVESPFPNPFTDHIMLRTGTEKIQRVELMDALGRVLFGTGPFLEGGNMQRIPLPALAPGSYALRATTARGASSVFLLQH